MILVKQSHEADVCVSFTGRGKYWVRGKIGFEEVDTTFYDKHRVKFWLQMMCEKNAAFGVKVFDMTESL